MTVVEHLLVCLSEECSEIAQATNKALRFGLDDHHPKREDNNLKEIIKEIQDLLGVVELLIEQGITDLSWICDRIPIEAKKEKVKKYMEYARERGTLQ